MILLALALAAAAHRHPSGADAPPSSVGSTMPPAWSDQRGALITRRSQRERGKAAKPTKGEGASIDAVARQYAIAGELLVAKGDRIILHRAYGTIAPAGGARHKVGERWRLASVTKQVTAALVLKNLADRGGDLQAALDAPVRSPYFGTALAGDVSGRQLLTHHSGLANPDDTVKDAAGVPAFYRDAAEPGYCFRRTAAAGGPFAYNNCDFQVLSALLPQTGSWPAGMAMARPGEAGVPGFVSGKPEPKFELSSWGPAGGLIGTARAVFDFDRSLMTGKLLPAAARDELWKPEGNGSYQALGQWVFPGKLAGCAAPKRIVQRDGEIWGVQVRNFILPDDDTMVIVFTNRSADDFAMGEVWQGKGFAYDILSAAACT